MNTKLTTNDIAAELGVTPRRLRQFLRSNVSTYTAVGSGARYEFKSSDVPGIRKRYTEWSGKGQDRAPERATTPRPRVRPDKPSQEDIDRMVWTEEEVESGPVILPDIRDPRVRKRVRELARQQEELLDARLMALGLHVTQLGDKR